MATKDFMAKVKQSKKEFDKGKMAKASSMIDVPAGNYIVRFDEMILDVGDRSDGKGIPFVQFSTVVVSASDDAHLGTGIRHREWIKAMKGTKDGKAWEITEADCFANICKVLQSFGVDTTEIEIGELESCGSDLSELEPACRVTVKEKGEYLNARFGKAVDDDTLPAISDVIDDEDDADDDADDADDDADDADDDDDAPADPVKGDEVSAKVTGSRKVEDFVVTAVNVKAATCTLKRVRDDEVFKNQSWDVIV